MFFLVAYHKLIKHSGNHHLIEACEIAVLSTLKGIPFHLHAEGVRGTGKTTILRSVKNVLPEIVRIKDCEYNCHPDLPHCPDHKDLNIHQLEQIGKEWITVPFFEISHTAKPGTIAGSIDLKKLTRNNNPLPALLPGIIPRAHRGIIFVDEINRLADTSPELADILLDVMGTKPGKIQVEETGLEKVELTVNVSVWAASNPDEDPGSLEDIRKQLSDRFDFSIPVERPREKEVVEKILSAESFLNSQLNNISKRDEKFKVELRELSQSNKNSWQLEKEVEENLAQIYVKYKLESLRALKALRLGAILKSILKGKGKGELAELVEITPLALKHRVDKNTLNNIIDYLKNEKEEEKRTRKDNYSCDLAKTTKTGEERKKQGKRSFLLDLLRKLRGHTPGKQGQENGHGSCKKPSNGGRGVNKSLQMKPDEKNVKTPEVDAKPLSELLKRNEKLVKEGEKRE